MANLDIGKLGKTYVLNQGSNTVSVINVTTNKVIATIPVGTKPTNLFYLSQSLLPSSGIDKTYVLNQGSNTVSVIQTIINKVVATIHVETHPVAIVSSFWTGNVYVTNSGSNTLSVINGTNIVVDTIPVGVAPIRIGIIEDPPPSPLTITAIVPSAGFLLGIFEKLNQTDYDMFTKVLTPSEKIELINNPTAENLDKFLNKLTPDILDKFLNKIAPGDLKDISNTLGSYEFTQLLNKISPDEHAKITAKIQSATP